MTTVAIIGGGAVGCAVAYTLAGKYEVFLFEKNHSCGDEQSGRNSGVNHGSLYYQPNSLKAQLCLEGNHLLRQFCREYDVPYRDVGKLVVPAKKGDEQGLEQLFENAKASGAEVSLITQRRIQKIEPNIQATCALYSPKTGIVDAATYVQRLAALAEARGAYILRDTRVTAVEDSIVHTNTRGSCNVDIIINAAGLYADIVAQMINPDSTYHAEFVRGEYCSYKSKKNNLQVKGNVYPVPSNGSVGVHLTPTFDNGKITVGPLFRPIEKRDDYATNTLSPEQIIEAVQFFFPQLMNKTAPYEGSGIMVRSPAETDFIIQKDETHHAIHLLGIGSPGLTTSLAIAQHVARMI